MKVARGVGGDKVVDPIHRIFLVERHEDVVVVHWIALGVLRPVVHHERWTNMEVK